MMLDSIDDGPLVYLTIEVEGVVRPKKYSKLSTEEQLQDDCDVQDTNIILYGLPPDVYSLVNHQEEAKAIWDRQGDDLIDCINKAMAFLSAVTSCFPSTNNQLRQSSHPRNQASIQDTSQTDDLVAYDSDCDDVSSAKVVLMENLSSCDLDVLSEVPNSKT
nr:hypothetical protein [Tanacetum cinerariifolium]